MNMILIGHGYTVAMIRRESRDDYLNHLEKADRSEDLTEFINYIASCCEYSLNLHLKAARGESIEDVDDIDKEIALFKKSLVTGGARLLLTRQVVATMYQFAQHCKSKAELLSDVFARVHTYSTLHGTTVEGQVHDLQALMSSQQLLFEGITIPEEFSSFVFFHRSRFAQFQGRQGTNLGITITNTTDKLGSLWSFTTNVSKWSGMKA